MDDSGLSHKDNNPDESATGEADTSDAAYTSSFLSNGSADQSRQEDEPDGLDPKTSAILDHLGKKIIRVRDLIKTEQKLRDGQCRSGGFELGSEADLVLADNVNEYLKLAANADKHQVQRIKAVFEKKNQKSAQVISQLQKKLDNYQKRVHEIESGVGQGHRPPREVLRDMGQGLK